MEHFPNWVDHILAIIFCICLPILAIIQTPKDGSEIEYNTAQKKAFYISTCITLAIMASIILIPWILLKRPITELGLHLNIEGTGWIMPLLAFVLLFSLDSLQTISSPSKITDSIAEWKKRTPFLPINFKEFRSYLWMCLCSGLFEEVIYRGFLVTYFKQLFEGSPNVVILSVLVPAFIFSISHYYHGFKNMAKIFVFSTLFGYIFILSDSLLIVVTLHFLTNAIGGLLSIKYLNQRIIDN